MQNLQFSYILYPQLFVVIRFRYNGTTGIFTVPEGGSGLYFLYIHLITTTGNFAAFELKRNEEQICVAEGDNGSNGWNHDTTTCGAVVQLNEGEWNGIYTKFLMVNSAYLTNLTIRICWLSVKVTAPILVDQIPLEVTFFQLESFHCNFRVRVRFVSWHNDPT